jgi:hypothetical protein
MESKSLESLSRTELMVLRNRINLILSAQSPGDSLPYPKVTKKQLDDELDKIAENNKKAFKDIF